jgi:heme/copper-type cytochrome/quinol oxidase subunit 2
MQLKANLVTILITVVVPVIIVGLCFVAWRRWKERRDRGGEEPVRSKWREGSTVISIALVLISALMFAGYAGHNAMIGGDQGGNSTTLLLIKTGNSLSFLGIVLGLIGKGRGRFASTIAGCCTLFLWFWQGMSL